MAGKSYIMKKVLSLIVTVAMLTTLVAGCSDTKTTETTAATEATTEATTAAETKAEETEATTEATEAAFPLTFMDSVANEVVIESEPQKIISVSPTLTEIIYAIGQGDKLVGRTSYDDYPAEVVDIPSVGDIYSPDVEAILALEPDLVLASSIFSEDSYNQFVELGIQVVVIVDEKSYEGTYDVINAVGTVLGAQDEAANLIADMQEKYDTIAAEANEDAPSVYYCLGYGESGDFAATGDTFTNDIIVSAGAQNAASEGQFWSFSVEALIEADPDVILLPTWMSADEFMAAENYSELTACQNGHVYNVDGNLFERQGPRSIDGIMVIADIINNLDVEEVVADETEVADEEVAETEAEETEAEETEVEETEEAA